MLVKPTSQVLKRYIIWSIIKAPSPPPPRFLLSPLLPLRYILDFLEFSTRVWGKWGRGVQGERHNLLILFFKQLVTNTTIDFLLLLGIVLYGIKGINSNKLFHISHDCALQTVHHRLKVWKNLCKSYLRHFFLIWGRWSGSWWSHQTRKSDFTLTKTPLSNECLFKIWCHSFKPLWKSVNLGFLGGFSWSSFLGKAWAKKNTKYDFLSYDWPEFDKIDKMLHYVMFYMAMEEPFTP